MLMKKIEGKFLIGNVDLEKWRKTFDSGRNRITPSRLR